MNKPELLSEITKRTGSSLFNVNQTLNCAMDIICEKLTSGEKVMISGFGSFELRTRKAHGAANPKTGEKITVGPFEYPVFTPSKALKEQIKNR